MCLWTCPRMRVYVRSQTCWRKRPCRHISAAQSARFPITVPGEWQAANGGREGEMRWLSRRCLERQVGQFGSWNLTRVRCQHQSTARKAYNRASSISWPSCWAPVSFVTSGKLAGWSVHLYNTHPDFERGKSENCAYYDRIFTARQWNSKQQMVPRNDCLSAHRVPALMSNSFGTSSNANTFRHSSIACSRIVLLWRCSAKAFSDRALPNWARGLRG